jgi:hypothetical protein
LWTEIIDLPTQFGEVSGSGNLDRNYSFFRSETVFGQAVYSSALGASTLDPEDGLIYYTVLQATVPVANVGTRRGGKFVYEEGSSAKIILDSVSGTLTWYDSSGFPDSYATGPIGVLPPVMILQKDGTELDDPHLILRGDSSYSRIEFRDSSNTAVSALNSTPDDISIKYGALKRFRADATGLSLFGVAPVARPTTSITAAAFVANTSGIVDDTATYGGYTIGQIVAALKALGILT